MDKYNFIITHTVTVTTRERREISAVASTEEEAIEDVARRYRMRRQGGAWRQLKRTVEFSNVELMVDNKEPIREPVGESERVIAITLKPRRLMIRREAAWLRERQQAGA